MRMGDRNLASSCQGAFSPCPAEDPFGPCPHRRPPLPPSSSTSSHVLADANTYLSDPCAGIPDNAPSIPGAVMLFTILLLHSLELFGKARGEVSTAYLLRSLGGDADPPERRLHPTGLKMLEATTERIVAKSMSKRPSADAEQGGVCNSCEWGRAAAAADPWANTPSRPSRAGISNRVGDEVAIQLSVHADEGHLHGGTTLALLEAEGATARDKARRLVLSAR